MANELVARNGLRVSGSTFLGNVATDQTLLSVLAIDSSNEVKDLSLATFAGDFVTGATLSGTGDKDLVLTQYDGTTITLTDINLHVDSASFDLASGDATLTQNDGNTVTLSLGTDFVTGVTEANNTISVTKNGGATVDYDITALTGLTYAGGQSGSWSLDYEGSDITAGSVELPFITGATLDLATGTLELEVNNGLENNFSITGFSTTNSDTFATGMTLTNGDLVITLNDGNDFNLDAFRWYFGADSGSAGTINLESQFDVVGGLGISTSSNGLSQLTVELDSDEITVGTTVITLGSSSTTLDGLTSVTSTSFIGDLTGNADTATTLETTRDFEISGDITASAVSFDGSGNVNLVASIEADTVDTAELVDGAVTTAKIADGDVTNAKLENSGFNTAGTSGTGSIDLGDTITFSSTDGSVTIDDNGSGTFDIQVSAGVDTFITGGTYTDSTGVLTLTDNGGTVITVDGEWNHLESASIANNVITFTSNTGQTSTVTVDAVTGITYGSWDVSFDGSGTLGTTPVELPFITGGTYNAGTVTLGINGGVESDIVITGLTTNDTHVTGATVDFQEVTLELNQSAPDVVIDSEQTIRYERVGSGTLVNIPVATYGAAHVEYTIIEDASARSGFFTAVFNAGQVEYADWSTMDIGSLTGELSANTGGDIIFTGVGRLIANVRAVAL
jgi:hypothetical protein